ncbi:MAG: putative quinol monooxygenase [Sphingopyxis sp.]|nr:putative quinol monooxygenase [Sphingopyxis sp.]
MIIVEGWARIAPGEIERMRDAIVTMVTASRAEDGCLDYSMAIDLTDPAVLRIAERWVDQAALDYHFTTPHMAAFQAALGASQAEAIAVYRYDCGDSGQPLVVRGV